MHVCVCVAVDRSSPAQVKSHAMVLQHGRSLCQTSGPLDQLPQKAKSSPRHHQQEFVSDMRGAERLVRFLATWHPVASKLVGDSRGDNKGFRVAIGWFGLARLPKKAMRARGGGGHPQSEFFELDGGAFVDDLDQDYRDTRLAAAPGPSIGNGAVDVAAEEDKIQDEGPMGITAQTLPALSIACLGLLAAGSYLNTVQVRLVKTGQGGSVCLTGEGDSTGPSIAKSRCSFRSCRSCSTSRATSR